MSPHYSFSSFWRIAVKTQSGVSQELSSPCHWNHANNKRKPNSGFTRYLTDINGLKWLSYYFYSKKILKSVLLFLIAVINNTQRLENSPSYEKHEHTPCRRALLRNLVRRTINSIHSETISYYRHRSSPCSLGLAGHHHYRISFL